MPPSCPAPRAPKGESVNKQSQWPLVQKCLWAKSKHSSQQSREARGGQGAMLWAQLKPTWKGSTKAQGPSNRNRYHYAYATMAGEQRGTGDTPHPILILLVWPQDGGPLSG